MAQLGLTGKSIEVTFDAGIAEIQGSLRVGWAVVDFMKRVMGEER